MTSEQITEWRAFYKISPWDYDRIEYLFAGFEQLYASAHRRKGSAAPGIEKFLMYLKPSEEQQEQKDFDDVFSSLR